jgi:hypothetical protein
MQAERERQLERFRQHARSNPFQHPYAMMSSDGSSGLAPAAAAPPSDGRKGGEVLDPNEAFLVRHAQAAVQSGRVSAESASYAEALFRRMGGSAAPVVEKARELIGDQKVEDLTQWQRNVYSNALRSEMSKAIAKDTLEMFQEQKGIQEFAQEGKATGDNYWFEAGATLTAPDLPRELKDDLFEEMKRDRPEGKRVIRDTGFNAK